MNSQVIFFISAAVAVIVFFIVGFRVGITYRKKVAEAELGRAEEQAKNVLNDAYKSAESKKRELLLEAKKKPISSAVNLIKK